MAQVQDSLISILVCPETKQPVRRIDSDLLAKINALVSNGQLKNNSGQSVTRILDEGLIREDRKVAYPVWDGIPVMLIEERIEVPA